MVIGTHKKPTPNPVIDNAQAISNIDVFISNVAIWIPAYVWRPNPSKSRNFGCHWLAKNTIISIAIAVAIKRRLIRIPTVKSGTSVSCWSIEGISTIGVTNNIPNIQCMPIPNAKLRSRKRRRSNNGSLAVKLWEKNIQPNIIIKKHSSRISPELNHSSRSPRSSTNWMHAIITAKLINPIQSSVIFLGLGGSGFIDFNNPNRARNATGTKMKNTQDQDNSSQTYPLIIGATVAGIPTPIM